MMRHRCRLGFAHEWPCRAFDSATHRRVLFFPRTRMLALHILERASSSITLDELARVVGLNKTALCRYVRSKTGITPLDLVRFIRLSCAATLLEETDLPIGEIAERVGYRSLPTFSRTFKDCFTLSPAAYRKCSQIDVFLSETHRAQGEIA